MGLPIIIAVEDEGDVRADLQRDLTRRYSADYQVLTIDSPERGLELLTRAQRDKTEVAIVIASLRLTAMGGVDVLVRAHELHPMARRALLIRVSDGESVAIMEQAFVMIGARPLTDWLPPGILRDPGGYILTGPDMMREGVLPGNWTLRRQPFPRETSLPGVFAVGDVRHGAVNRVASAVGDGAIAVQMAHEYLKERSLAPV